MSLLSTSQIRLRIVLPVALTRLYFKITDLSRSRLVQNIDYMCSFEDDAQKIARIKPDVWLSLVPDPHGVAASRKGAVRVRRLIVASPKLLGSVHVRQPKHLEDMPYATLSRAEPARFYVNTPHGETMEITPGCRFNSNDVFAAHEAANLGIAYAVLPKLMVMDDLNSGRLISLLPAWTPKESVLTISVSPACEFPEQAALLAHLMLSKLAQIPGVTFRS